MALPVISNVYRCALNWSESSQGQTAENVIHVRAPSGTAAEVAAALSTDLQVDQWTYTVSTATINSVTVTPLDGSSASYEAALSGSNVTGGTSGNWTTSSCIVVTMYTDARGRSYRGRSYTPFLSATAQADGQLNGPVMAHIVSAWNAFQLALNGDTMYLCVASYKHASSHDVTSFKVLQGCGTQRRRQERVRYP